MTPGPPAALVCTRGVPDSERQAGSRRIFNLIEFLREEGWHVALAAETSGRPVDRRRLQDLGVAVFGPNDLEDLLAAGGFDIALLAFWELAERLMPQMRELSPQTRVILDSIDLHFVRGARERFARRESVALEPAFGEAFARELNAYADADAILTVSEKEAALVEDLSGGEVRAFCVPLCESESEFAFHDEPRHGGLFLANFQHPPNSDALQFLCEDILPLVPADVRAAHPTAIVGNRLEGDLLELCRRTEGVVPVGWVPSVAPYLARARVMVAPLRYGAGTKLKVIQALMMGTPTVATTIAVEGIDVAEAPSLTVVDDPEGFAHAFTRALTEVPPSGRPQADGAVAVPGHTRAAVRERFRVALVEISGRERKRRPTRVEPPRPAARTVRSRSGADRPAEAAVLETVRRPIFVVGSPRSGTSILTWSVGQHPNVLPLEESDWLAKLAANLVTAHRLGSARGPRSQLSAMGIDLATFMAAFGDAAFDLIVERKLAYARAHKGATDTGAEFQIVRSTSDPKSRWVDGTPEYSHHIAGLTMLFPHARFIHILRDAGSAVRSMVNFHLIGGPQWTLVQSYRRWLGNVRACLEAEAALGCDAMLRITYSDLTTSPEATLRRCFDFLGEPFSADCLKPLRTKINSSPEAGLLPEPATPEEQALAEEARALSDELLDGGDARPPAPQAGRADEWRREYLAATARRERGYASLVAGLGESARPAAPVARERPAPRPNPETRGKLASAEPPAAAPAARGALVMKSEWDERARENAMHYIASGRERWEPDEFFASGRQHVESHILSDSDRVFRGRDPKTIRMLEIGCGIGRMSRALAEIFGEVHGVDVSGEMIAKAKALHVDFPNVHLYETSGTDLSMFPDEFFEFAFSFLVFQHIPYRDVIVSYFREVYRTLAPGCLFKFQVQGGTVRRLTTWTGVGFSEQELSELADDIGFEALDAKGEGTQYFWNWWRRP